MITIEQQIQQAIAWMNRHALSAGLPPERLLRQALQSRPVVDEKTGESYYWHNEESEGSEFVVGITTRENGNVIKAFYSIYPKNDLGRDHRYQGDNSFT
jgi:hypothetical protein